MKQKRTGVFDSKEYFEKGDCKVMTSIVSVRMNQAFTAKAFGKPATLIDDARNSADPMPAKVGFNGKTAGIAYPSGRSPYVPIPRRK